MCLSGFELIGLYVLGLWAFLDIWVKSGPSRASLRDLTRNASDKWVWPEKGVENKTRAYEEAQMHGYTPIGDGGSNKHKTNGRKWLKWRPEDTTPAESLFNAFLYLAEQRLLSTAASNQGPPKGLQRCVLKHQTLRSYIERQTNTRTDLLLPQIA